MCVCVYMCMCMFMLHIQATKNGQGYCAENEIIRSWSQWCTDTEEGVLERSHLAFI